MLRWVAANLGRGTLDQQSILAASAYAARVHVPVRVFTPDVLTA
jgi:hypothetical protein